MSFREKILLFFIFFLIFCFSSSFKDSVVIPDEEYMIRVAQNLAEGKTLSLPERFPYKYPKITKIGKDGNNYSIVPIGQSIVMAPFYLLSKKLNVFLSPFKEPSSRETLQSWADRIEFETTRQLYIVPALLSALSCLVFYLFCFALNFKRLACFVTTSIFAFGTMIWPYSKFLLSESTQTFFLLSTVYLLFIQRSEGKHKVFLMILAGISFGLLNAIKPTFLILLPIILFYWLYQNLSLKESVIPSLLFLLFSLITFSLQLGYNFIRFSNTLDFGYKGIGFTTPLYVGLYGLLLSSGKSFFLYSPVTFLFFFSIKNFYRMAKREALLFIAIIVTMILVYSKWFVWAGDYSWGPRFLVPLIPFFMIPTCVLFEKVLTNRSKLQKAFLSLLVLTSLLVQIPATAVHYLDYLNYFKLYVSPIPPPNMTVNFRGHIGKVGLRDNYLDFEFIPEFSPILGNWWVLKNLALGTKEAFEDTPWKNLGMNRFHENIPLKAEFDLWTVNLILDSIKTNKITNIFWIIIMFFLILIVSAYYIIDIKMSSGWYSVKKESA